MFFSFAKSYRALLAGGFGTGRNVSERPLEIAPVVPSGQDLVPVTHHAFQRRHPRSPPTSPPNGFQGVDAKSYPTVGYSTDAKDESGNKDLERGEGGIVEDGSAAKSSYSATETIEQPLTSPLYARFHLDMAAAVAAAVGDSEW